MAVTVPNAIALANIPDGSAIVASDHRNNYAAVQVGVNGLVAMFTAAPTKGDLLVSTGGGNFDKLPVGANNQVPVADSTQATGLKYTYPPGYEILAAAQTADQTNIVTGGFSDLVTLGVADLGGVSCYAEIIIPNLRHTVANATITFHIAEDGVQIGNNVQVDLTTAGQGMSVSLLIGIISAGAHTYKVQWIPSVAGTATVKASIAEARYRIVKR